MLDTWHLNDHFYDFANFHYEVQDRPKAAVPMNIAALRENKAGDVLGRLKKMKRAKKGPGWGGRRAHSS